MVLDATIDCGIKMLGNRFFDVYLMIGRGYDKKKKVPGELGLNVRHLIE